MVDGYTGSIRFTTVGALSYGKSGGGGIEGEEGTLDGEGILGGGGIEGEEGTLDGEGILGGGGLLFCACAVLMSKEIAIRSARIKKFFFIV